MRIAGSRASSAGAAGRTRAQTMRRRAPPWLALALFPLLARCGCLLSGVPGAPLDEEDGDVPEITSCVMPVSYRQCPTWRCAQGVLIGRTPEKGTAQVTGELKGQFISSLGQVDFRVGPRTAGGVEALYSWGEGCSLAVTLADGQTGAFSYGGVELTGKGELSSAQRAALDSLNESVALFALVQVPLLLGCQNDVPDAYLAALLFPWQVILKHDPAPNSRAGALEALGTESTCRYFTHRIDDVRGSHQGPLRFASSDLIPNVFGWFPLDGVGASEPSGQPLEGALDGPCGARCRGACGADCPSTNCTTTYQTVCHADGGAWHTTTHNCGVHDGCVRHDDCYDRCNWYYGCATWGATVCRRTCDGEAVALYGAENGALWSQGYGTFQRRIDFVYRSPADPDSCSCVASGTLVTLADGSRRPIEALEPGDRIAALELDGGTLIRATVERVLVHRAERYALDELVVSSGQRLEVTGNHPVLTVGGFVSVEALAPGDVVFVVDEAVQQTRRERVVAITRRHSATSTTYNLKTTAGNYFAADILIHNKCLSAGSTVETLLGPRSIDSLAPGDLVRGERGGERVWTPVLAVYRKQTVLPALPGKRLAPGLAVTVNHLVSEAGRPAGALAAPDEEIAGPVFDLDTGTGNYLAAGVLLEAANGGGPRFGGRGSPR